MQKLVKLCALVSALATSTAAWAQTVVEETVEGGSIARIEMPDDWNGGLVIYNHGFDLFTLVPESPSLGPLAERQLEQGYAVAASSYSQNGWALFNTRKDLEALMELFRDNFDEPDEVFVHGYSLGGIVSAQAWESADLGNVVGAYPACGAMAGSRNWDGGLDLRLGYDAVCADVPGAKIPGGGRGLPYRFTEDPNSSNELGAALQACFGIFSAPEDRSADQAERLETFLETATIPESFVVTTMGFAVLALSDLVFDPTKLNGKRGFGNDGVVYNNAEVDATIRRVSPRSGAEKKLTRKYEVKGNNSKVKIISTHTTNDGLVLVENQQVLSDIVSPDQLTVAIVNEGDTESHCGFSEAENVAGWEELRDWTAGGPQPTAQDIQDACLEEEANGAAGPCRFDPDYELGNLDTRIYPR